MENIILVICKMPSRNMTVVVAQSAEQLLPIPEVQVSKQVIGKFYTHNIYY